VEKGARGEKRAALAVEGSGAAAAVIYSLVQRGTLVGLDRSSGSAEQEVGSDHPPFPPSAP